MARPQRPLDATRPLHAFAAELRKIRATAGNPKYLAMARKVGGISRTALAEAAGGDHLPTWRTVEKYVLACGGDPNEWRKRWEDLRDQVPGHAEPDVEPAPRATAEPGPDPEPTPQTPDLPNRSRPRRGLVMLAAACSLALAGLALGLLLGPGNRTSPDSQPRTHAPAHGPAPTGPAVIVQNMIAVGADSLIEDPTPAYLSTRTVPRCRLNGCMVPKTILVTGVSIVATCHVHGTRMTNYNLDSTEVQHNPHRVASTLWYRLVLPDGRAGFLSEVYLAPASRGGLNLPTCAPDVPVTQP